MENARFFFEIFFITIPEKKLILFANTCILLCDLVLRFKVKFFLILKKNLFFRGLWFKSTY